MADRASRGAVALELARDALSLGGAAAISYGAWLIYAPAGFITGGVLALAIGAIGALRSRA